MPRPSALLSSQEISKCPQSTLVNAIAEVAALATPFPEPSFGSMDEGKASCDDSWIKPKRSSRCRNYRKDHECKEPARELAKVRSDSKLRGSSRQNLYLPLAEGPEEEEEEKEEESLGSLVAKKNKKKRKLEEGAASNIFVAASNFFEGPLKAWGGKRESTNMPSCETGTEKGENG